MRDAGRVEALQQSRKVVPGDGLVGNDDRLPSPQQRQDRAAGLRDQAGPDENVIAALAELRPAAARFRFLLMSAPSAVGRLQRPRMLGQTRQ